MEAIDILMDMKNSVRIVTGLEPRVIQMVYYFLVMWDMGWLGIAI